MTTLLRNNSPSFCKMWYPQQKLALQSQSKTGDKIVFATFVEGERFFSTLPDKDEFAKFILSGDPGSTYCMELLYGSCFGYCDLDSTASLSELGLTEEQFVATFNAVLQKCYKEKLDIDLQTIDISWTRSTRPGKMSYHVRIGGSHYWDDRKEMKEFFEYVNSCCCTTSGLHFYLEEKGKVVLHSVLDMAVYSKNRCMRATGCRKPAYPVCFLPIVGNLTHSCIVANCLTVCEKNQMKPHVLKSKCQNSFKPPVIQTQLLNKLAAKYGSTYVCMKGNIAILRNNGCRLCPIGAETNESDNCFLVLKSSGIYFGCHNEACLGKLMKVHEQKVAQRFTHYSDYKLLFSSNITRKDVHQYMKEAIRFVDKPSDPFFVTTSLSGVPCFENRISAVVTSCSKTLFTRNADILIPSEEKEIKFSKELNYMTTSRQIPTYSDCIWQPFLRKNQPVNHCPSKLNLFQGFVLEDQPSSDIDFVSTKMYDLIKRLAGSQEALTYLLDFIAAKLQFPYSKKPIALCFINSKEGVGKGTFGLLLEKIFACGTPSYVSFNSLDSFANSFNGIKSKALFICLEEVTAKKNCLRSFNELLKDQISSCVILEEIKNKERTLKPWFANILVFSNDFNVMSCSRNDRRLVMFESDSTKANDKFYFVELHKELNCLKHIKSAFDYFANKDCSNWNYRKLPYSQIKSKLANCSEKNVSKFHRWLLTECYANQTLYSFTEHDVYCHYRDFVELFGVNKRSDRSYVCNNLELYLNMTKVGESYTLTNTDRVKYLKTILRTK